MPRVRRAADDDANYLNRTINLPRSRSGPFICVPDVTSKIEERV
jgi:hypothetical protein